MTGPATSALRPWQQSAIGDRRSVLGALAIVLIAAFYVVGVPFLEENLDATLETDEAGRYVIDDYATLALPEGWSIENQNDVLTTLTDGTYQFIVIPTAPAAVATATDALQSVYDTYAAEPANVVTPLESFTTDAGADAAGYRALVATDPSGNGLASYAIIQNGRSFQPLFTGPSDLSDPFYDDAQAIVMSVEISAEPRSGS